jgi:cytochrome P450
VEKNYYPHWFLGDLPEFDRDFLELFKKFKNLQGDTVILKGPLGYRFYGFFHPDAVEYILSTSQNNFPRLGHFTDALGAFMGKGLLTTEGSERDHYRTSMNPSFALKNLIPFSDWIVQETETFCEKLPQNTEVDFFKTISHLTLRITLGLIFGPENIKCDQEFEDNLEDCLVELTKRIQSPFNFPKSLPTSANLKARRLRKKMEDLVDKMIENSKNSSHPSQLNFLNGLKFSPTQIRDQIIPLLLVGNDAFALSLAWTWYALGSNPKIEERLREELQSVLKKGSPSLDVLKKIEYTAMVYQESMRLFPPAYAISRQNIAPDVVTGTKLKKNSIVVLSQYITHRHPDFWEKPFDFYPDHFTEHQVKERHNYAYFPFGSGKRICIGKTLSMNFGPLILATILNRKKVMALPGQTSDYTLSFALRPKFGIKTIF